MASLITAALVKDFIINKADNNVTLISLLEQLQPSEPSVPGQFVKVYTSWERRDNAETEVRVRILPVAPSGVALVQLGQELTIKFIAPRHRWLADMPKWTINEYGKWRVRIDRFDATRSEWETVSSLPLDVNRLG